MKERFISIILVTLLILLNLTGCRGKDLLSQYQNAINSTNSIKMARENTEFKIKFDLANSKLTPKTKKLLEIYSNIEGNIISAYDREKNILMIDGHIDMKSMGFDFKIYEDKEKILILLPMFSKYMVVKKSTSSNTDSSSFQVLFFNSREIRRDILYKSTKGENISNLTNLISTPEGELKSYYYDILINEEQFKESYVSAIGHILNNEAFKDFAIDVIYNINRDSMLRKDAGVFYSNMIESINKSFDNMNIADTTYRIAVDKDSIIREESESFKTEYVKNLDTSIFINISLITKRWDVEKNIKLQIPEINNDTGFDISNIEENIPPFYKNLFKEKISR